MVIQRLPDPDVAAGTFDWRIIVVAGWRGLVMGRAGQAVAAVAVIIGTIDLFAHHSLPPRRSTLLIRSSFDPCWGLVADKAAPASATASCCRIVVAHCS